MNEDTSQHTPFNDDIVENPQSIKDRGVVNKFITYINKLEEENKHHNTVNKTTAVWEYILAFERTTNELNNRIGQLEQKISILEKSSESRRFYAPSFVKRKDLILNSLEKNKIVDLNEVRQLLGLKSYNYTRQLMRDIAKEADVAFVTGNSRTPSKLVSKHFTFQEIKDHLLSKMPQHSSMLVHRLEEQFFIPNNRLPDMVRFLHPQFKHRAWKDGARIERIK